MNATEPELTLDKTTQKTEVPTENAGSAVPNIQIPGYKILRELGHGGMAYVYLAIQESFDREVALKVLSPHLSDDELFTKRFLREAQIVSQLNHPNIVTVFDAGKHGKHHYMSMEYIPGKDLKNLTNTITSKEALSIIKNVAQALAFAGKKGIVHRDVKPENIMIHESDNHVVLMDFGIAYGDEDTQNMTQTGEAIGTPHFMSPEQAEGQKVDHRSDIYSLGIVFFQLLAKRLPFEAASAVAVGIKHLSSPIPKLPEQYQVYQNIINRCLAKQPQNRYQSAVDLISDLESVEVSESGQAAENPFMRNPADEKVNVKKPNIAFPSANKAKKEHHFAEVPSTNSSSRNLLLFSLFLLLASIAYTSYEKRNELTHFWGYKALPKIVKAFPNLFPASYSQYWANKLKHIKNRQTGKSITVTGNENLSDLFKQAKEYLEANQLIRPQAHNAYDIYQQILKQDADNLQAQTGLKTIHYQLAKKITSAINEGQLKISEDYLQAALRRYGKSSLLASVQTKLKEAVAPRIKKIKLSDAPINDLANSETVDIELSGTLYIGFNFINFDQSSTWLDATLFDMTNDTTVTHKPVVISSQAGEHLFEMNFPKEQFLDHDYKLELKLKNRVLLSKSFSVEEE